MTLFILYISIYLFSGFRHGAYYIDNRLESHFWSLIVFCLTARLGLEMGVPGLLMLVPLAFTVQMAVIMSEGHTDRVHLIQNLQTYSLGLLSIIGGADVITVLCAGIAGDVLFNMPVQWYSYKRLVSRVNPTYELLQFTLFGKKITIKKPRIGNGYIKLGVGVFFLCLYLINYYFTHYIIILW